MPVVIVKFTARRPDALTESAEEPLRSAVADASFGVTMLTEVYGNLKTAAEEAAPKMDWVPNSACLRLLKGT
jgi:hypothetical protein